MCAYDYRDEADALLFQVCRFAPKDFRQRRPDPNTPGGWNWSVKGVRRVLFRLPEVLKAVREGKPVFVAEGEKDVASLVQAGFEATTNPGGAGKWRPEYSEALAGAEVVILPDSDEPGRKHAQAVAAALHGTAKSVRVVELPGELNGRPVKDSADYFAAGGEAADLYELTQAAPEWAPPDASKPETREGAADIRGELVALLTDNELPGHTKRQLIGEAVVSALARRGRFYFHAERRDFETAMFFDRERHRLERVRADAFIAWLADWLRVNHADPSFKFIRGAIETAALVGDHTTGILPEAYWAARPGALFLSNGDGRAVRISAEGVADVDNGTEDVLFAAGQTLAPWRLTEPRDPFAACRLFSRAHAEAAHGAELARLWLFSFPTNLRSKPPLVLAGPVGSGKTRFAKGFAELFGLPFVAAKVEEHLEANFWPSVDRGGLFVLDNADTRTRWLADSLAAAATDGCASRRRLYTDRELVTLRANAWLVITSANPTFGAESGLADRLLLIRMSRREGEATGDSELGDEILAHRDAGLSFIAKTLARALADAGDVPEGVNLRHPDFARFAVRIGRALGRGPEAVAALAAAESDKSAFCLENDTVGAALVVFVNSVGHFEGTAAELLPHLAAVDGEIEEHFSPKRLAKRLVSLWLHLGKQFALALTKTDPGVLRESDPVGG